MPDTTSTRTLVIVLATEQKIMNCVFIGFQFFTDIGFGGLTVFFKPFPKVLHVHFLINELWALQIFWSLVEAISVVFGVCVGGRGR